MHTVKPFWKFMEKVLYINDYLSAPAIIIIIITSGNSFTD